MSMLPIDEPDDDFDDENEPPEPMLPLVLNNEELRRRWIAKLKPPTHLDSEARRKWREVLNQYNDWSRGAVDLLTLYAAEWSRWKHAEAEVAKDGAVIRSPSGYLQPNPWLAISRQAHDRLLKVSKTLGIAK